MPHRNILHNCRACENVTDNERRRKRRIEWENRWERERTRQYLKAIITSWYLPLLHKPVYNNKQFNKIHNNRENNTNTITKIKNNNIINCSSKRSDKEKRSVSKYNETTKIKTKMNNNGKSGNRKKGSNSLMNVTSTTANKKNMNKRK